MRVSRFSRGGPTRRSGAGAALVGALALAAACGAPVGPAAADTAPADQPRALSLRYDIYVGGFYVFAFNATVGLESGAYQVALQGGTAGFVGRMFPWRAWMDSKGSVASVDPAPTGLAAARFDNVAEWHHKAKRTSITFEGGGRYAIEHDPPEAPPDPRDDPLPRSLPSGTMDPVAAAIAAFAGSARDGGCERRVPVFDGKRRYDLIVHNGDGLTTLKPNRLSAYRGLALSCRIAIDAISGFSKKRRYVQWGDTGSGSDQPTVWAAWFAPDMPLVPVRFVASVSIGGNESTIMVHLVHAEVRDGHGTRVLADLSKAG